MPKISGIYANAFGAPVADLKIMFTARVTSSGVMAATVAVVTTAGDGAYSCDVMPGVYAVTAGGNYLGLITVTTDTPDQSLNDYLST